MPVTIKTAQFKYKNGEGEYVGVNAIGDEDAIAEIDSWLDRHPEATTTVQDGSITYAKLHSDVSGDITGVKNALNDNAHSIPYETEESKYHANIENIPKITFIGNADAFSTAKYADSKNLAPVMTFNGTRYGVAAVFENGFLTMNGTGNANNTFLVSYIDFNPYLPAGDYTFIVNIDKGNSSLTNSGLFFFTLYYASDANRVSKHFKYNDATFTITATEPVRRIAIEAGVVTDNVYDNYKMWFGVFPASTTIVDTEHIVENNTEYDYSVSGDIATVDTMQHKSTISYMANLKEYIDALDVDIDEKLTYITPERFGAVGDNQTDDYNALVQCLAYGITNHIPIRGFGRYRISSGLTIECDDMDIYINSLTTTSTNTEAVVKLTGYRNKIRINRIYAYNVRIIGFWLYGKNNHWSEFNTIHLPCIYAGNDAIFINAESNSAYACENVFYVQYIRSDFENCIYEPNGFGENTFHGGGGHVVCPNGWAIKLGNGGGNKFYNFALENEARSGIWFDNGSDNIIIGFRLAELRGKKTPTSGDVGTVFKFSGTAAANYIECAEGANLVDIDVTDATPNSELTIAETNYAYSINTIRGNGVRGSGFDWANGVGYYALYGKEVLTLRNKKIVVPLGIMQTNVTSDIEYGVDEGRDILFNWFTMNTDANITLCDSYCPIGFNEIYIDQANGKATVYKNNSVIFNGANYGSGIYKLVCYCDTANNVFNDNPEHTYKIAAFYDGENEVWKVLEV